MLVAEGADVNAKDFSGLTALHLAADFGHATVVELLLTNGADANARNRHGLAPLDRPAVLEFTSTVELIIDAGGKCGTNYYQSKTCKEKTGME